MTSSRDFTAAVRSGRRAGRRSIVVHLVNTGANSDANIDSDPALAHQSKPGSVVRSVNSRATWTTEVEPVRAPARVGLIVSKSVGNAVVRHAVSRRLRAAARTVVSGLDGAGLDGAGLDDGALLVIRALAPAADDDTKELTRQLRSGLAKLGAL